MNTSKNAALAGIAVAVVFGCAGGCAERSDVVQLARSMGTTDGLIPGDPAPDFAFIDGRGGVERFSAVRQRVTVVVFPDRTGNWPDPTEYQACARLAQHEGCWDAPALIVLIGPPHADDGQAERELAAHPTSAEHLLVIADDDGTLRRHFGPGAAGHFFVIDRFNHIVAIAPYEGPESLRVPLRNAVDTVLDDDARFPDRG